MHDQYILVSLSNAVPVVVIAIDMRSFTMSMPLWVLCIRNALLRAKFCPILTSKVHVLYEMIA